MISMRVYRSQSHACSMISMELDALVKLQRSRIMFVELALLGIRECRVL